MYIFSSLTVVWQVIMCSKYLKLKLEMKIAACIVCILDWICSALINSSTAQHDCPVSFFYYHQLALMTTSDFKIIFVANLLI